MAYRSIKINVVPIDAPKLSPPHHALNRLPFQAPYRVGKLVRNGGYYVLTNTVRDVYTARSAVSNLYGAKAQVTLVDNHNFQSVVVRGLGKFTPHQVTTAIKRHYPQHDRQGIIDANFIVTRHKVTSTLLRLTFMGPAPKDLQNMLRACFSVRWVKVEPFTPNPLRCRHCHGYHPSKGCQATPVCGKCSQEHSTDMCTAQAPKCPNCKGAHTAYSTDCPFHRLHFFATQQQRLPGGPSYSQALRMGRAIIPTTQDPAPPTTTPSPGITGEAIASFITDVISTIMPDKAAAVTNVIALHATKHFGINIPSVTTATLPSPPPVNLSPPATANPVTPSNSPAVASPVPLDLGDTPQPPSTPPQGNPITPSNSPWTLRSRSRTSITSTPPTVVKKAPGAAYSRAAPILTRSARKKLDLQDPGSTSHPPRKTKIIKKIHKNQK